MTSSDGSAGNPLDPDFAGLFRPEPEVRPAQDAGAAAVAREPSSMADHDPVEPAVSTDEHAVSTDEPAVSTDEPAPVADPNPAPSGSDPIADTGRLFRSQGVVGHDDAVLALAGDRRLRTLERRRDDEPEPVLMAPIAVAEEASGADVHHVIPAPEHAVAAEAPVTVPRRSRAHRSRSITAGAVYLVVIGVTVLVGFANALISDGDLGWPTGLALVASSVYAALTVRREDDTAAIIIPPVAFLIAALTAGQAFVGSLEGSLLNRAVLVFFTLADNWVWIIGATVAALAIVLVRRRRA